MKLQYLVLGFKPLRVKFFYEEKGREGEFYIDFSREAKNANNMDDSLGVRGVAEIIQKDPDYADDLLQGLAEELKGFTFQSLLCPTCRREYDNPIEMEAIEKIGECLGCDSIRADAQEASL